MLDEKVPEVRPRSFSEIESIATAVLEALAPEMLIEPMALDIAELIDYKLGDLGIWVHPVSFAEMPDNEADTTVKRDGESQIRILYEFWDDLFNGGPNARRPRATIAHELGHAILHRREFQGWREQAARDETFTLARKARREIPAFKEPEWQAWAFAGSLLMPWSTLQWFDRKALAEIVDCYQVSEEMARKRLNLLYRQKRISEGFIK